MIIKLLIEAKFSKKFDSQLYQVREEQILIIRVPITSDNHIVGTLEIGEQLVGLETRKDILLSILISGSAIAIILSLLGGGDDCQMLLCDLFPI